MTKQDVNSNLDDGIEEIKLDDKTTKSKDKDNKLNNVTDAIPQISDFLIYFLHPFGYLMNS
jgi:hypothetical protein